MALGDHDTFMNKGRLLHFLGGESIIRTAGEEKAESSRLQRASASTS